MTKTMQLFAAAAMAALTSACGQPVAEGETSAAVTSVDHVLTDGNGIYRGEVEAEVLAVGVGLDVQFRVELDEAQPNAAYVFSRAPEPQGGATWASPDGVCQRGAANNFVNFICGTDPITGAPVPCKVTTDAAGKGRLDYRFHVNSPLFPDGSTFDVQFRLLAGASDLRSDCTQVTVL